MNRLLIPTAAISDNSWENPQNAITPNGLSAVLEGGDPNDWLVVGLFSGLPLPTSSTINGITVFMRCPEVSTGGEGGTPSIGVDDGSGSIGSDERLQVALSSDGTTMLGEPKAIVAAGEHYVGDADDLWGHEWTLEEFNTLYVMVRRGDVLGGENTATARRVDAIVVTAHFETGSTVMEAITKERLAKQQKTVIGWTNKDNEGLPTILLKQTKFNLTDAPEIQEIEEYGSGLSEGSVQVWSESRGSIVVAKPTFNEIVLMLMMRLGQPTSHEQLVAPNASGKGVYRVRGVLDPRKLMIPLLGKVQQGDENISEQFDLVVLNSFGLSFPDMKTVQASGNVMAKKVKDRSELDQNSRNVGQPLFNGQNQLETLTISGSPTGGNLGRIRWKGKETTTIAYNANSASIQTKLNTAFGNGTITVSDGVGSSKVFEFNGADVTGFSQPTLEIVGTAFTGGSTPTAVFSLTRPGGWQEYTAAPIVSGRAKLQIAPLIANLDTSMVNTRELGISFADAFDPDMQFSGLPDLTHSNIVEKPTSGQITFGVTADSLGHLLAGSSERSDKYYARLIIDSDQKVVEGSNHLYYLGITGFGTLKKTGDVQTYGQVVGRQFAIELNRSVEWGRALEWEAVCQVAPSDLNVA
jgi:hypothetical protein